MKPFWLSFLAGWVLVSAAIATFAFVTFAPRVEQEKKDWALIPVVVMSSDVSEGRALTFDYLTQRSIPARFVTGSMVRPNDVSFVIDRAPTIPLNAGEILLWSAFADNSATDACFAAIAPKVRAAGVSAREVAITRLEQGRGAPLPAPEPLPVPQADASGNVSVVVFTAHVPEGKVLEESMLAVGQLPKEMVTASLVPADRLRDVIGTRLLVEVEPTDSLRWQMLDDAQRPRRSVSCSNEAAAAQQVARDRATREECAAFMSGQEAH